VPAPELRPRRERVLVNEPLRRNMRSRPHVCEELYRTGGEPVYVCPQAPLHSLQTTAIERRRHESGFTADEREAYFAERPEAREWTWTVMMRNPDVYARGRVRHPDHRTISLDGWHRVHLNNEERSDRFRFSVKYLD
jgi:hypothetical protein